MITVQTSAGEVVLRTTGSHEDVEDWGVCVVVELSIAIGQRSLRGDVSVTKKGKAIGQSRDAWVSSNILNLLDAEVPAADHRAVLDAIEMEAGRRARFE